MFSSVPIKPIPLRQYSDFLQSEEISEIERLAGELRGARVLNLNTTGFGTRVADMIGVLTGLMQGQQINCEWQVLRVTSQLIDVYRHMYDAMQSANVPWDPEAASLWQQYSAQSAQLYDQQYDFIIVHDPQGSPLLTQITKDKGQRPAGTWIWHCHFDLRQANPEMRRFLADQISGYDSVVAEMESYLQGEDLPNPRVILPAIDPLSPRNADVATDTLSTLLFAHKIAGDRPIVSQICPLEPAVDPMGAVAVWRMAAERVPGLQLVLAFPIITRGTATEELFHRLVTDLQDDPDAFVLSPLHGLGNLEVNLLRQASAVLLQKSIGRGFGLVVAEGMWKGRPVIAGDKEGVPLLIEDGETGYIADSVETCAGRLVSLLQNPGQAREMGARGRERVRQSFLITRYFRDYLSLLGSLAPRQAQ